MSTGPDKVYRKQSDHKVRRVSSCQEVIFIQANSFHNQPLPIDLWFARLLCGRPSGSNRFSVSVHDKSLVPYRQCSARRNLLFPMLLARSIVDTAICAKPLGRWMYGDWMPLAGN